MSDAAAPALDPAVLDTLRQLNEPGQPDVLQEVFSLFLSDAPARLEAVEAAVRARDSVALQRTAHTLKGAAGTIGAGGLQAACRALEDIGRGQELAGADQGLVVLRAEYERVRQAIDQLL
jgi:HPt (histidine-containing phosphotransfer) domain-containing protein